MGKKEPEKKEVKVCEYSYCMEKATTVCASEGRLYHLCQKHKKAVQRQNKANNQI